MSELCPIPPDVRKRIEKWLKEHVDETSSSDDVPCVVVNEGADFTASLLDKLIPRRQREAMEKLRRGNGGQDG